MSISSMWWPLLYLACARLTNAKVYFKETFDELWESRWVKSKKHENDNAQGDFGLHTGKWYTDPIEDLGLETDIDEDHRYFQLSASFPSFTNKNVDLYIQFQVKWERDVECGGSYIKVGPKLEDPEQFGRDTPWHIMFGPDKCGPLNYKTHLIFHIGGKEVPKKEKLPYIQAHTPGQPAKLGISHLYRLVLTSDNTVRVEMDGKKVYQGNLVEDWEILAPEWIPDPDSYKADWWDEREGFEDPNDKKPEDWVDEARLPDPEALKPTDWDPEEDGEWEPSTLPNPEFKGNWHPKQIRNARYMGKWRPEYMANPDYQNNKMNYLFRDIGYIGLDLWQVKGGTIFDNIIITDNKGAADKFAQKWKKINDYEMAQYTEWDHARLDQEWYENFRRQDVYHKDYWRGEDQSEEDL
mmetsp:Transcript_143167/g.252685  ORF Transcript_143167/g.252685 Transcript_143167/m.252685 type:complete len:409 (-) Transcript_143167:124-1350(-)